MADPEILSRLDQLADDIGEVKADVSTLRGEAVEIRKQTTITNGNVKELQLWRARVEGMMSVGSNPIVASVASAVLVAALLTVLRLA